VSDFSSVQTVYVAIGASAEDASDNAIDAGNVTFTIKDTQGPSFIWDPTNGDTGVPADANVTLTFAELIRKVDDSDLTDANVGALLTLKNNDASGSDISFFDATVSSGGGVSSLYFDGVNDYVTVQREVQDNFTLQAWVKTETSRSGSKFYQGLGIVYADFPSRAYDFGTSILNGKFSFGTGFSDETILSSTSIDNNEWNHVVATRTTAAVSGNTEITIAPTSDFNSGQIVYAAIGATVEDLYDNPSTASNTTFTIADILKPTITFSPSDGSQGVEVSSNITITFNEAVRHLDNTALSDLNVDALIALKDTDANGSDISFDATINTDKTIITVDPVSDFSSVQTVYVAIGASAEDASDNAIDAGNVTFTIKDTQGPSFIWDPTNGDTGVPADANVTLTFAELIRKVDDSDLTDANVGALLTLKNNDASGSDISFFDATVSSGGGVSSLYFDGVNDYVTVQREVQDNFTLQAWVKTETSRSGSKFYQGLGIVYADFPSRAYDFGTSILNGKFSFGTGFSDETILSSTSIDNNEWNHVVATRTTAAVSGNTEITIAPTSDFNSGQIVYAAIGATVEDLYDNPSTASNTTFTIADILKPTVTFSPSDGENVTVGLRISAIVNVVLEAVLGLSYKSSTVAPMAAYTTWPELKSLVDAIVMTVLPADPGPSLVHSAPLIVPWLLLPLLSLSIVPVPSSKSQ
jgi:hypothetical protein